MIIGHYYFFFKWFCIAFLFLCFFFIIFYKLLIQETHAYTFKSFIFIISHNYFFCANRVACTVTALSTYYIDESFSITSWLRLRYKIEQRVTKCLCCCFFCLFKTLKIFISHECKWERTRKRENQSYTNCTNWAISLGNTLNVVCLILFNWRNLYIIFVWNHTLNRNVCTKPSWESTTATTTMDINS